MLNTNLSDYGFFFWVLTEYFHISRNETIQTRSGDSCADHEKHTFEMIPLMLNGCFKISEITKIIISSNTKRKCNASNLWTHTTEVKFRFNHCIFLVLSSTAMQNSSKILSCFKS